MKFSNYNFFYQLNEENYLAYNALKNGLAVVKSDIAEKLIEQDWYKLKTIEPNVLNELTRGGFLISEGFVEWDLIKTRFRMSQFSQNGMALTITPTTDCNLKCKYCYEPESGPIKMNDQVIQAITEYVKRRLKNRDRYLSVTWYGGEPLLYPEIIEKLSHEFIRLCRNYKADYSAYIITNGTLLNRPLAEKLKKLKVKGAQITLDGECSAHDQRRPYKDGSGSFKVILENLKQICTIMNIALRVNVDKTNCSQLLPFYKQLVNEGWFFKNKKNEVYFGHVRKYTTSCKCESQECLLSNEYWKEVLELNRFLRSKGLHYYPYPSLSLGCGANSISHYVIGPEGELYKCWNNVGDKSYAIGSIFTDPELNSIYLNYLNAFDYIDDDCKKCKVFPLCNGGCVDLQIRLKTGEYKRKECSCWKFYLEEALKDFYLSKVSKRLD